MCDVVTIFSRPVYTGEYRHTVTQVVGTTGIPSESAEHF